MGHFQGTSKTLHTSFAYSLNMKDGMYMYHNRHTEPLNEDAANAKIHKEIVFNK